MKKIMRVMIAVVLCAAVFSCATSGSAMGGGTSEIVIKNDTGRQLRIEMWKLKKNGDRDYKDHPSFSIDADGEYKIVVSNGNYAVSDYEHSSSYEFNVDNLQNCRVTLIVDMSRTAISGSKLPGISEIGRVGLEKDMLYIGGGQFIHVDYDAAVKAAFNTLDPVFQKNLKSGAAIAVFPISTASFTETEVLYDQLQINLMNSGKYKLVEKRHVDALLDEYDFQKSGEVGVLTIGELLEADAVILGSVTGRDRDWKLSLIAVDMAKRATLATAQEKLKDLYPPKKKAQKVDNKNTEEGIATVLLLPAIGGTNEENLTLGGFIANLRDINSAVNLIDESQNTAILPVGFTGLTPADNELLNKLGVQYKAHYIIYSNIQKFGQRNIAIVSRYSVFSGFTNSSYYLEYSDPIEGWIKLPGAISVIMKTGLGNSQFWSNLRLFGFDARDTMLRASLRGGDPVNFQVKYEAGVERVFADRMIGLLMGDFSVVEEAREKHHSMASLKVDLGKTLVDRTADIEAGRRDPFDWANLPYRPVYTFTASRQGNKTRLQVAGKSNITLDFTDARDFIRQMRGLSLTLSSEKPTAGYDLGIAQGEKYNYWKYAGEDSSIPEIITYANQLPPPHPNVVAAAVDSTSITVNDLNYLKYITKVYYSTEKDFSKARLAERDTTNAASNGEYILKHWVRNLQPDTLYYIWKTHTMGGLTWLESEPAGPVEVRTKPGGSTTPPASPASQYRSRYE